MKSIFESHIRAIESYMTDSNLSLAEAAFDEIVTTLKSGHTVLICWNGWSAADSQHIAAEIVGRYKKERRGLPAIALTTDTSNLTAIGNDYGYDRVFSRQVEALGRSGDILLVLSTSGNSVNVVEAVKEAKRIGMKVVGFLGRSGGILKDMVDYPIVVSTESTAHIQECHMILYHAMCEKIDLHFD